MGRTRRVIIMPVRLNSTRFPNKAIHMIDEKPLFVHLLDKLKEVDLPIVIACPDKDYPELVKHAPHETYITSNKTFKTGTDRVAHTANMMGLKPMDLVINVQCDQLLVSTGFIKQMVNYHKLMNTDTRMSFCLTFGCQDIISYRTINTVKMAVSVNGKALYFRANWIKSR